MLIIGEKLNSSVPRTLEALNAHNAEYLTDVIRLQEACGADYLDINTALTGENEIADMEWLVRLATEHTSCGIMIDSPNPEIIRAAIPFVKDRKLFINSITLDEKYESLYEDIRNSGGSVVCLPIVGRAIPMTAAERVANAKQIVEKLTATGIPKERIYIDVLVEAVATNSQAPSVTIDTIRSIKAELPGVSTVCGLSNISFGLPRRGILNATFLAMCMAAGLDSAILDVTSLKMQETLAAAKALLGEDDYCMDYISFIRDQE